MIEKGWKKGLICVVLAIIFAPMFLGVLSANGVETDVPLSGNTAAAVEAKPLTVQNFADGSFQSAFTGWFDGTFSPRGVLIRTFNTVMYGVFKEASGKYVVCKNGNLLEDFYILAELKSRDTYDASLPETRQQVDAYAARVREVAAKLKAFDKTLCLYLTPGKGEWRPEDFPLKYRVEERSDGVRVADYLREALEREGVDFIDAHDVLASVPYPPFYTTGIHWARPVEQRTNNAVLDKLSGLSGKSYRKLNLGGILHQNEPFWRDGDLLDLLNLWGSEAISSKVDYYEYEQQPEFPESAPIMRLLLQGGSYSEGLRDALRNEYPESIVNYIFYNMWFESANNGYGGISFNSDWSQVPLGEFLDQADCVLVEINDGRADWLSNGFIEALDAFLDAYSPGRATYVTADRISFESGAANPAAAMTRVYGANDSWLTAASAFRLSSGEVEQKGLDVSFSVVDFIFEAGNESDTVRLYVNGVKAYERTFTEPWSGTVTLGPQELPPSRLGMEGVCAVTLYSDACFVPAQIMDSPDQRPLYLLLDYVGPHAEQDAQEGN